MKQWNDSYYLAKRIGTTLKHEDGRYNVVYDACESGMTFFYYGRELYKRVSNSELTPVISDYYAPTDVKMRVIGW